jgi:hypothetical protein
MPDQRVTLNLPEAILQRANQAAQALQHPVEEVLVDMLAAVLPDIDDAPDDMRADLTRMTWLSDQELWNVARDTMPNEQQERLQRLAEIQAQRPLTPDEQRTLDALRTVYGRVTLRKARAYALLSLRGGAPLLADT